jgi:plastocyanin
MSQRNLWFIFLTGLFIGAVLLLLQEYEMGQHRLNAARAAQSKTIEAQRQNALAALRAQQSATRGTNTSKRKVIPVRSFPSQPQPIAIEPDAETPPEAAVPAPVGYQVTPPAGVPRESTGYLAPSSNSVVTGRVTLRGTPPPEKVIEMDETCGRLHTEPVTTRHYVVDENGGLGNVFIHVIAGLPQITYPAPAGKALLDQVDCMYEPYVSAVLAGQKISVRNSDSLMHNVHATPKVDGNRERNVAEPVKGMQQDFVFDKPEVLLRFKCDVHNWMFAYVSVVAHRYFAVTAPNGTFEFPAGLPPGKYIVEAVHLKAGTAHQAVEIRKDLKPPVVNFVFDLTQTAEK